MSGDLLEIRGLVKNFGGVHASDHLSMSVREGETHAVIGPNGAGKTTLISQISGLVRPDSGEIVFDGIDLTKLPAHRRAHMGLARSFQISSVFLGLSVLDNVTLAIQAHQGHSFRFWKNARLSAELRDPALAVLQRVSLAERAVDPAAQLSHGERRQLEFAMALATEPRMLLLDEPMAGMGREEGSRILDIITELHSTKTLLLVEHDMDVVFSLADRISVLVYGKVLATGEPQSIRANEDVQKAYLGETA